MIAGPTAPPKSPAKARRANNLVISESVFSLTDSSADTFTYFFVIESETGSKIQKGSSHR